MHHLLHHANCADGFAAACIARHALLTQGIPETDLTIQAVNYGWPQQIPASFALGDDVTYLDYTPSQEDIEQLLFLNAALTIIDHHSTAAERHCRCKDTGLPIADLPAPRFNSWFNLKLSGASLAWTVFHQQSQSGQSGQSSPIPRAIELIEWRDLGYAFDPLHQDDPRTNDALNLHAYLFRCLPRTFEAWTPLLLSGSANLKPETSNLEPSLSAALQTGSRLRLTDSIIIAAAANHPHWLNFHGDEIPAVNGLDAGLISDACTELLKAYPTAPFAASWFIDARTGKATYSLRSRRNSAVNVAEIAASMAPGGGGHPNAAGFSSLHPIPFV
jgi:hypothetical protein